MQNFYRMDELRAIVSDDLVSRRARQAGFCEIRLRAGRLRMGRRRTRVSERLQNWLTRGWKRFSGGCHLNRAISNLIEEAGFHFDDLILDTWSAVALAGALVSAKEGAANLQRGFDVLISTD
jgi:hypothetical protein